MARYKEVAEKAEVKREHIKSVVELYHEYDKLVDKAQMHTDSAYTVIIPIDERVFTNKQTGAMGKLDTIKFDIQQTPLKNTTTGKNVLSLFADIEELDQWRGRYTTQLEQFLKDMMFLLQSSFKIIKNMQAEINRMQNEISGMNELHTENYPQYNAPAQQEPRFEKPVYQPEVQPVQEQQQELDDFEAEMEEDKKEDENDLIYQPAQPPVQQEQVQYPTGMMPPPPIQQQEPYPPRQILREEDIVQQRKDIVKLYKEGRTQVQIAHMLGISQSKVSRALLNKDG